MSKKRICFISLVNLYLCPYITKYISLIDCDYDIIYWNRHGIEEDNSAKQIYAFPYKMEEGTSKLNKLIGYQKFRRYAFDIINRNDYSGIILLQTSAGILLHSILKRKYKDKYIIDIRDYTMENNPIFYFIEKSLIDNSALAVISSKGYENFLPPHNYILVHNDSFIDERMISKFESKERNKDRIVISYIGLVRFHEQNKKVILKFKNDNRFILRFIGKDAFALERFCRENNVSNVELIDWFPPEKTLDYYYEADIIYNLYGNNTPLLDYALSNKLYYAAKFKMPILVCPNTYMEEVSKRYGFGFTFDLDDPNACDDLYDFYVNIDWKRFYDNCNSFLQQVKVDNLIFEDRIKTFIDNIK